MAADNPVVAAYILGSGKEVHARSGCSFYLGAVLPIGGFSDY
jgi:hypothetical protein